MKNAGLFLAQLHSQAKALKQLISPRLGNQVNFAAQLLQAAPPLQPDNKDQLAALSLGARVKLDPYTDRVTLMKTIAATPNSPREKMPLKSRPCCPTCAATPNLPPPNQVPPHLRNSTGNYGRRWTACGICAIIVLWKPSAHSAARR
jgi:hypothetical protein